MPDPMLGPKPLQTAGLRLRQTSKLTQQRRFTAAISPAKQYNLATANRNIQIGEQDLFTTHRGELSGFDQNFHQD